jgi:hypothetical protein
MVSTLYYCTAQACNEAGNQCVHGAYTSGKRAAEQIVHHFARLRIKDEEGAGGVGVGGVDEEGEDDFRGEPEEAEDAGAAGIGGVGGSKGEAVEGEEGGVGKGSGTIKVKGSNRYVNKWVGTDWDGRRIDLPDPIEGELPAPKIGESRHEKKLRHKRNYRVRRKADHAGHEHDLAAAKKRRLKNRN